MISEREATSSGAIVFRFEDERIAEIGVEYNAARVTLATAQSAPSTSTSLAGGEFDVQSLGISIGRG